MKKQDQQFWLWVTRPEYYLDDDGQDREDLDPINSADWEGWWTCHKETKKGDLVFLWRTSPKKDIGYLIQAKSDAYSLAGEYGAEPGWNWGCDYRVLHKFAHPVTIQDFHSNARLQGFPPYRGRFQGRVFRIAPEYWALLNQLAVAKNPGYRKFTGEVQQETLVRSILREDQLEDALAADLGLLRAAGYDLELYVNPSTGATGRQFICPGAGGRIDLLCYERRKKRYVVIELKNVPAGHATFGQIFSYVGWVQNNIAGNKPVIGLVISRGKDPRFEDCLAITDKVDQVDIGRLGFE